MAKGGRSLARSPVKFLVRFLASGAGSGYAPFAPGTIGTLVAVPLCLLLRALGSTLSLAATLAVAALAVPVAGEAERQAGVKDPGFIVIDEVAGFLVTMWGIAPGWPSLAAGFVLFRACDIIKPPPAGAAQRLPGGLGIVADDLVAGLYANLALRLLIAGGLL